MKSIFLFGGVCGFLTVGIAGLCAGRSPNTLLFDASIGCLAGALFFRWFWSVLLRGIRETYLSRVKAANAAEAAAKTKKA